MNVVKNTLCGNLHFKEILDFLFQPLKLFYFVHIMCVPIPSREFRNLFTKYVVISIFRSLIHSKFTKFHAFFYLQKVL
jgi:hypothetical protein